MQNSLTETIVGAFVVALAAWFIAYAAGFIERGTSTDGPVFSASFRNIEGVTVGTDVRMAGVKVGSVTDIILDPTTFRANTELSFNQTYDIPDDSAAVVASEGLLGGSFIEIVPGGSPFNLEDGDSFEDTQGAVSLINLLLRFVAGSDG